MAIYLELIEAAIKPLIERGFAVTECVEAAQNFGDARIVLASDKLMVRFTSDRGQLLVDVAPSHSVDRWYGLSELFKLVGMTGEAGPWESARAAVDELEKHEVLIVRRVSDPDFTSRLVARR